MTSDITLESVTKSYPMGRLEVLALRGVDMIIDAGSLVGVVGPSGSGKTTLLNILGGVDPPTAGNVLVFGKNVARMAPRELDAYRRESVGYVFQFFNLVQTLTAEQNVKIPMLLRGLNRDRSAERAHGLLSDVGLEGRAMHLPSELSGGEQQRVAIAVALANNPPLLLADEPTGELDSRAGEHVIQLLHEVARKSGRTTIIASHDPRLIGRCDVVYSLLDGRISEHRDSRVV